MLKQKLKDMTKLESTTRGKLTDDINAVAPKLKVGLMMVTCFRATKDNQLQVEFAQKRNLSSSTPNALTLLNKGDDRFRQSETMLYDWLTMRPENFINAFGDQTDATVEKLKEIAATWTPDAPTGRDAIVFPQLDIVRKFYDESYGELTPILLVTEKRESELDTFYNGDNAAQKIQDAIESKNNLLRTGSDDDAEDIVDPETGERIYRFVQTNFVESGKKDTLIKGKMTRSEFERRGKLATSKATGMSGGSPQIEDILNQKGGI
jgi:hypothetical protein